MPKPGKEAVFVEEIHQLIQQSNNIMRKEIIESNKAETAKVVKEVSDLRTSIEKRISAIELDLAETKKTCASNLETILKEMSEVEEKRPNILVFGLPEPLSGGRNSPRDQDAARADQILEKILGRKSAFEIKFRIGPKVEDKVRPIVVKLRNFQDKDEILARSSTLKDHEEWKNVYIKQDLTKSQRDLGKKHEEELRKEAERKNSLLKNGEDWTWGIRGIGLLQHLVKLRNKV